MADPPSYPAIPCPSTPRPAEVYAHFAPATYRNWLVAGTIPIYIVNTVKPPPAQH